MMHSLYIAWKYVSFNKLKTVTLVACITLIAFLPLALQLLLEESERQLLSRAVSTPLLIGAKGSALDLVMNSLYFGDEVPEPISIATADRVWDSNLATPIPLYVRFRTRGYPIVGTAIEYFDFRGLHIAQGRLFTVLGECVVGMTVAERFGLQPGDTLLSSPENLFDLAGVYPLKMQVVGILARSHTADDLAVFADLKTTWVIEGLGHGHADLRQSTDASVILKRTPTTITANAKLQHYTQITDANLAEFHFHGELTSYPITAVIAVPPDTKAATLLRGRYLSQVEQQQIVKPDEVIDGLLQNIFRIKQILDAVIVIVGLATVLAIILVFALSLRLRQREIDTIFKLGCRRMTIARLLTAEIGLIVFISGGLCFVLMLFVQSYAPEVVRIVFVS